MILHNLVVIIKITMLEENGSSYYKQRRRKSSVQDIYVKNFIEFCIKSLRPSQKENSNCWVSLVKSNKHNKIVENLKSKQRPYKPITFSHEVVSFFARQSLETVPFIPVSGDGHTDTSTQPIITVKQSHDTLNYCYLSASSANLSRKAGHENLRICLHRIHIERCRNA